MDLSTPITSLGRLYQNYAKRLEKLEITTLKDFLYHLPNRFEDFSKITPIGKLEEGQLVTIHGNITQINNSYTRTKKQIQKATISDETGSINVIWFNQPYIAKSLKFGDKVALSGRVIGDGFLLSLNSPDFEVITENGKTIHTGRLVPIYPETAGVSSKWLRRQVDKILNTNYFEEFLPTTIIQSNSLMDYKDAISKVHFPNNLEEQAKARERLGFDEVFLLQLANIKRRNEWQRQVVGHKFNIEKFQKEIDIFWEKLPFTPTNAQRNVIHEIFNDLTSSTSMNRLLQGDVGSGKTVVAAIAMYLAFLNGYQSVLMAPTQILANQHYQTIKNLLEPLGVKIGLQLGGSKSKKQANQLLSVNILIGTHAVLNEKINFNQLGLVVIDEQHRFGVEQRSIIRAKGDNPHVLTMTATPIPRTVALTLYGNLDLSVLNEMPKGRKIIKTWVVPSKKRESAYSWIEGQIQSTKSQAFIICPFIEESETLTTIKAATTEFERLQKHVFPKLKLGLLHGRMRGVEKDKVLEEFRKNKYDILVATPVVEVGIDIPNATIILIEASDRFGLSQLHQLRGRVGRGQKQSFCLLFSESPNLDIFNRLKNLEKIHNGAELSELDLRLRGAGELYGTLQHGRKWLKIASFSDVKLLETAKKEALRIFNSLDKFPSLLEKVDEVTTREVSPD